MARRPDIISAVQRLGRYVARDEWLTPREAYVLLLVEPILDEYGLTLPKLTEELAAADALGAMLTFIDESFFGLNAGPNGSNAVDDYLRRRGWQESPRAREYLQQLRSSVPSLYEVQDVSPGEWIDLRDRLHADAPIEHVAESSGSQALQRYDCFIARLVQPHDEIMLTGGVLALTREMADRIEDAVRRNDKDGDDTLECVMLRAWLRGMLDAARRPLPQLQTTHGEAMLISRTRLPLVRDDARFEISRRLDAASKTGWKRESPKESRWVRLGGEKRSARVVLASAWLERDALVVETLSRERMADALATVESLLDGLVKPGLTSHEDPFAALSHGATRPASPPPVAAEDAATIAEAVTRFKDDHYRRTLDDKVPALGNRTPRQCIRSKAGRKLLVRWLKNLENGELRQARDMNVTAYDVTWLWRELGMESER